jgi:hypothetical protein
VSKVRFNGQDRGDRDGTQRAAESKTDPTEPSVAGPQKRGIPKRTCPACGITVVLGYVVCPKCKAELPRPAKRPVGHGTAVPSRTVPLSLVAAAALATAVIWHLANREDPVVTGEAIVSAAEESANDGAASDSPAPTAATTGAVDIEGESQTATDTGIEQTLPAPQSEHVMAGGAGGGDGATTITADEGEDGESHHSAD